MLTLAHVCIILSLSAFVHSLSSKEEIEQFFSSSFVRRYVHRDVNYRKLELFHIHHVCTNQGKHNLFIGFEKKGPWIASPNKSSEHGKHRLTFLPSFTVYIIDMTISEWNRIRPDNHPLVISTMPNDGTIQITQQSGNTLFANCWNTLSTDYNPSRLLMKLGFFYELATTPNSPLHTSLSAHVPFQHAYLHQCPDINNHQWTWGQQITTFIKQRLQEANLLTPGAAFRSTGSTQRDLTPSLEYTCFDDIFLSDRYGSWVSGVSTNLLFREELIAYHKLKNKGIYKQKKAGKRKPFCPARAEFLGSIKLLVLNTVAGKYHHFLAMPLCCLE